MAEHWKSTPRYWCKQCKIYIRDTAFEKTQHEATGRHQGNLKRFLRDIHRDNERQQRDTQRAKSEVERLRQAVSGSPASAGGQDSDSTAAAAAAAAPPPPPQQKSASVEERKKQMAQLAEMGVAIPDEYRGDMSLAGDWQTVSTRVIREEGEGEDGGVRGVRKRKMQEVDEEEEEAKREAEKFVSRPWGSRTRVYPGAVGGEDTDLDALLESTRDIKKGRTSGVDDGHGDNGDGDSGRGEKDTATAPDGAAAQPVKQVKEEAEEEEPESKVAAEPAKPADDAAGGVVFKKRKPKVMRR
ncbi:hypothetical protein P168DRAFT_318277 [Aspergillus campestris IBT 28561]|uniref:U1-type domain-containing protein n=1 Tax=Aspergillus campestris (strain IBT 28561) TaxID=1392248 RepID=A0A2I1D5U9_ASPC2|nr:uncharacterized protein P168DRAFT_318277 [Aspergillus campestris IBT 28561]PKY05252.1 hypothetical protein P168DRAFT_318277 [Aspergillus campestris IBT 28561]